MTDSSAGGPKEFDQKTVVVTGGSAGIGLAIARAFAGRGARIVIAARNLEATRFAAGELERETGAQVLAIGADIGAPQDCARLVDAAVKHFGAVDILINNAAAFAVSPLLALRADDASRMLHTNILGALLCGQAMARWVIDNRRTGAIVNVSSISAERPTYGYGLYAATKAALNSLTKSMAVEWTSQGLRVNGVAPGHVSTEAIRRDVEAGKLDQDAMLRGIPAGRMADGADVADAVLFLCSARSRQIVGQILSIDGGESM